MRKIGLFLSITYGLYGQATIQITSPTPGQVASGWAGAGNLNPFTLAVSLSSDAAVRTTSVCYQLDGYDLYNPGWGGPFSNSQSVNFAKGCSTEWPFSMPINTYWTANATNHSVVAVAKDAAGSVVATSAPVAFAISNDWPVKCSDGSNASSTGSLGSLSNGYLPVTLTVNGSCATDTKDVEFFVDGIQFAAYWSTTQASFTAPVDTTKWSDGVHRVCWAWQDLTNYSNISGMLAKWAGEWCAPVTFSNTTTATETRTACSDCRLTPGQTVSLAPTEWNADGTQNAVSNFSYLSANTSIATVSTSGVVTATSTMPAWGHPSSGKVYTMAETVSGTDLNSIVGTGQYWSNSHPFTSQSLNTLVHIFAGGGWSAGVYRINSVDIPNHVVTMIDENGNHPSIALNGTFATGPTSVSNILVWPDQTTQTCFATDGTIKPAGDPACFYMHSMFASDSYLKNTLTTYNYKGGGTGPHAEFDKTGFNTWEISPLPGSSQCTDFLNQTQAQYETQLAGSVAGYVSALSDMKHATHLYGIGDNMTRTGEYLYACAFGAPSGYSGNSSWTSNAIALSLKAYKNAGHQLHGMNWADEVSSSWGVHPLAGPIKPGGANSWLTSIVSDGGSGTPANAVCTVNGTYISLNGAGQFIIHDSSVSQLNTTPGGAAYNSYSGTSTSFKFNCPNAPAGTYDSSNDPNLTLEPFAAGGWTRANNTDYIRYDAFARLMNEVNAAGLPGQRTPVGGAPPFVGGCAGISAWDGYQGDGSISGVSQVGEYVDWYSDQGQMGSFLMHRAPANWTFTGNSSSGAYLQTTFGCYSPTLPLIAIAATNVGSYGLQGYTVNVTSIQDDVATLAAPHKLTTLILGDTRFYIQGTDNAAYNNQQAYVTELLDSTHVRFALARAPFSDNTCHAWQAPGDNSTGPATLHFAGGYTPAQTADVYASSTSIGMQKFYPGNNVGRGMAVIMSTSADVNMPKHIGEKFTISGCTNGNYAGKTWLLSTTNSNVPGYTRFMVMWYVPSGTANGGTITIQPDNSIVCGRTVCSGPRSTNNSNQMQPWDPRAVFGQYLASAIGGAKAFRSYKVDGNWLPYQYQQGSGYNSQGWASGVFSSGRSTDGYLQGEVHAHPHFESGALVPDFNAAANASRGLTHWRKFLLQNIVNSPDMGPTLSCSLRSGTFGKALLCANTTNGTTTRTFDVSSYLVSGQNYILTIWGWDGTDITTVIPAGTSSKTITLDEGQAFALVFPNTFAGTVNQPVVQTRLSDIPSATSSAIRWSYNAAQFDTPTANFIDCGSSASCTIPADLYTDSGGNFMSLYYEIIYLNSSRKRIASSGMQNF